MWISLAKFIYRRASDISKKYICWLFTFIFILSLAGCFPSLTDDREYIEFPTFDLTRMWRMEMSLSELENLEIAIIKIRGDLIEAHYNNLVPDPHFADMMIKYECDLLKIRAARRAGLYRIYAGELR